MTRKKVDLEMTEILKSKDENQEFENSSSDILTEKIENPLGWTNEELDFLVST